MNLSQLRIQTEARERDVRELFHFTVCANIESILINGLASRALLEERGIRYFATDELRLDDCLDGVSLSIHSANQSMFAAKQQIYHSEWLIPVFEASILWTHPCRFCWANAADREIRKHSGFIGGPWAFQKMFEDRECLPGEMGWREGKSAREAFSRQPFEPTNNDAEVQVLSPISPDLILGVIVRSNVVKNELEILMQKIDRVRPILVDERYFL